MSSNVDRHIFQIGDYWLSQQARSPSWCRTWFDPQTRQTRRVSLRTTDLDEAKQRLTDWFVLEHTKKEETPSDVTLAELFARYYTQKGSTLRSADSVQRALRDWLDYHGDATVAQACTLQRQVQFREYLARERGLSASSIRTTLIIGKGALNWAWKRGEISAPPYIELVKKGRAQPKGRPLAVSEVARFYDGADWHLRAFVALMIASAGRTTAVLELTFDQIDFEHDLIHLNPRGREQTNKYRPSIKIPGEIRPWLLLERERSPCGAPVHFRGQPIKSIRSVWRSRRAELDMDGDVQPYSLRHTMARWLRKSSVPAWEVSAQLGHKQEGASTTEIYAPFDPAYLCKSTDAINAFFRAVACEMRVKTFSETLERS